MLSFLLRRSLRLVALLAAVAACSFIVIEFISD